MSLTFSTSLGGSTLALALGGASVTVDWGDLTTPDSSTSHTYATSGTYTVLVSGTATSFALSTGKAGVTAVGSYGGLGLTSLASAFDGATNLTSLPALPSTVTDTSRMLRGATAFDQDVSGWSTANVTTMSRMFESATSFNRSLSAWTTSKVTDMTAMFAGATSFNGSVSSWDTSKVTDMAGMFAGATSFNGSVSSWDTSKVTTMEAMFAGATSFNQSISAWDTSAVTTTDTMFYGATAFNNGCASGVRTCPLDPTASSWDTSKVVTFQSMFNGGGSTTVFNQRVSNLSLASAINTSYMFRGATVFNNGCAPGTYTCPMTSTATTWNSGNVVVTNHMFMEAPAFNQRISGMDTSKVTNVGLMFRGATGFNNGCPIGTATCPMSGSGGWDMAKVADAADMMLGASGFDQDVSSWDLSNLTNGWRMLTGTALSTSRYNALLTSLAARTLHTGVNFGAYPATYSGASATTARATLTGATPTGFEWTIIDGGPSTTVTSTVTAVTPAAGTYRTGSTLTFSSTVTADGGGSCDTAGAHAPTYALSADPTGGSTVPYPVSAGEVSTVGWAAGTYTVTATYAGDGTCEGSSATSMINLVAAMAPDPPAAVAGIRGERKIAVAWSAPSSDGGSVLLGYVVEISRNGGAWIPAAGGCATQNTRDSLVPTCQASGLDATSTYRVRVSARNAVGTGAPTTSASIAPRR